MPFATFSDEIAVFDNEEPFNIVTRIKVTDKPYLYGNITWSGDAVWLAATPSNDPLAIYKLENKQLVTYKHVNVKNVKSATFLNWRNRDLIFGLESGEIRVWNIKEKKISGTIDGDCNQSVNILTCNLDDTCIASGSYASNKIGIHSLRTNKFLRSLELPEDEFTSCLRFCQCKKGYLAASTSASTICVWDVVKSDIVYKTSNAHLGVCSGLEFSPVNFSVLATVSLSQQLKLYDLRTCDRIFDAQLNEPLHCIDIFQYGDKVAIGTSSGSVVIYDLRACKVFSTIKAHNTVVNALSINKLDKIRNFHSTDMDSPDTPVAVNRTLDLSVMDVFSPVFRDNSNANNLNSSTPSSGGLFRRLSSATLHVQNDSFLSKILSPKPPLMMSSPLVQTPSVSDKSTNNTPNARLIPVLEEEGAVGGVEPPAEGPEVGMTDYCISTLKDEIVKMQTEQNVKFKLLSDQLSMMEDVFIKKIETDYDTLNELLLNIIRRNLEKGFFEMRYELVTQRVVNAECFNKLIEKTDNIAFVLQQLVQQLASLLNPNNNGYN